MSQENPDMCTICNGEFNLDEEGGSEGFIGMLPVTFCPTCKCGIFDFVESQCSTCIAMEEDDAA